MRVLFLSVGRSFPLARIDQNLRLNALAFWVPFPSQEHGVNKKNGHPNLFFGQRKREGGRNNSLIHFSWKNRLKVFLRIRGHYN
jgi:hypothetical protein